MSAPTRPTLVGPGVCAARLTAVGAVRISAVCDVKDRDASLLVIDAVDDAVGAAPSAATITEWGLEPLADSLWVGCEGADNELMRGEGNSLRQMLR